MKPEKYDFSGYVTKNDIECTDGRVICQDAFKHDDGRVVPLVGSTIQVIPGILSGIPSWKIVQMECMDILLSMKV